MISISIKKKSMKIVLTALLLIFSVSAAAQVKKFKWSSGACDFESTFDTKKYKVAELQNTLKLIGPNGPSIQTDATVWKFADIPNLSLEKLDAEYAQKTAELKNLKIVKTPYFEKLRQNYLRELEEVYKLSRVSITAYTKPEMLKSYKGADSCVAKYANPLTAGGQSLLDIWLNVNKDSRSKNSDPERLRREFEAQLNSPQKYEFAQVEVMNFGWWNCANEFAYRVAQDGTSEKEFKKLFVRTKTISCEEP